MDIISSRKDKAANEAVIPTRQLLNSRCGVTLSAIRGYINDREGDDVISKIEVNLKHLEQRYAFLNSHEEIKICLSTLRISSQKK